MGLASLGRRGDDFGEPDVLVVSIRERLAAHGATRCLVERDAHGVAVYASRGEVPCLHFTGSMVDRSWLDRKDWAMLAKHVRQCMGERFE